MGDIQLWISVYESIRRLPGSISETNVLNDVGVMCFWVSCVAAEVEITSSSVVHRMSGPCPFVRDEVELFNMQLFPKRKAHHITIMYTTISLCFINQLKWISPKDPWNGHKGNPLNSSSRPVFLQTQQTQVLCGQKGTCFMMPPCY